MQQALQIKQLTVIGVGLIGGSIARALKDGGVCEKVVGYGRNATNLDRALELGVIDAIDMDVSSAVKDADVVVIAAPLGAMADLFRKINGYLKPGAVITDVGSVKGSVVGQARENLKDCLSTFVPGHPIAGSEQSGVEASHPELFKGRNIILTPLQETDAIALAKIRCLWEAVGANVFEMEPDHHDQVLAATSHLPHLLAYTLINTLLKVETSEEIFRFAAGGFQDFTRIASSDPVMWRDICLANQHAIIEMLENFEGDIKRLSQLIRLSDGDALLELFSSAKKARDQHIVKDEA